MIDRERVMQLYRRGKTTYKEIAAILNCSEKQVGRIVRRCKTRDDQFLHLSGRRGKEELAWTALAFEGKTLNHIAACAGVTMQAVEQAITPHLEIGIVIVDNKLVPHVAQIKNFKGNA